MNPHASLADNLPLLLAMQKKGFVDNLKLMQTYAAGVGKDQCATLIEQKAQSEQQALNELVKLLPKRLAKTIQYG
ncbi:MAG: hypothetical protein FJZ89_14275 [Chloroflexi bacterium]|nr:hypothetical protein [Chloroflexota bacterium]